MEEVIVVGKNEFVEKIKTVWKTSFGDTHESLSYRCRKCSQTVYATDHWSKNEGKCYKCKKIYPLVTNDELRKAMRKNKKKD